MERIQDHTFNGKQLVSKFGIVLVLFVLFVIMSILSPSFFTTTSLVNLIKQVSIVGIIAIGTTFVLINGEIDISVGSVAALCGIVGAMFACPYGIGYYFTGDKTGSALPLLFAILVPVLLGMLCGVLNGLVVSKIHVPSFIVTLAMSEIARGLALAVTGGGPIYILTTEYKKISSFSIGIFPGLAIYYLVLLIAAFLLLNRTMFGRYVFAIGGNKVAARNSGINVNINKIKVFAIAGALAGLGGMLLSSRLQSGSPNAAVGYEMDAIAACVLGGVSINGGIGNVFGALIGVLIMGILNNGFTMLGVDSYIQQVIKGVIIVCAVGYDVYSKRNKELY